MYWSFYYLPPIFEVCYESVCKRFECDLYNVRKIPTEERWYNLKNMKLYKFIYRDVISSLVNYKKSLLNYFILVKNENKKKLNEKADLGWCLSTRCTCPLGNLLSQISCRGRTKNLRVAEGHKIYWHHQIQFLELKKILSDDKIHQ